MKNVNKLELEIICVYTHKTHTHTHNRHHVNMYACHRVLPMRAGEIGEDRGVEDRALTIRKLLKHCVEPKHGALALPAVHSHRTATFVCQF